MENRKRRIGWTVLFVGVALWFVVANPWTTREVKICRDCLARQETRVEFFAVAKTVSDRRAFADWFEAQNPNHQHEWWKVAHSETGLFRSIHCPSRGWFGMLSPEMILRLAKESPSDYETYRRLVLSSDLDENNRAVMFSLGANLRLTKPEIRRSSGSSND